MKRVLIVFPTGWDSRQIEACGVLADGRYAVELATPTHEDCPLDFDVLDFIERTVETRRGRLHGVTTSSDYPGATVAAAVATVLGLPGSRPETVLAASHKYQSRVAQREAAPEATGWFELLDSRHPGDLERFRYPAFVKPVKGTFSMLSRRVDTPLELREFLEHPSVARYTSEYMRVFDRLLDRFARTGVGGTHFVIEELLTGSLVTVEGFVHEGRVELLGIVDSVVDPVTKSFVSFDYPSSLDGIVQQRMEAIACRVVKRLELSETLFNIEMIHDAPTDRITIIEVNPRMCGQFSDLYAKVDGRGGYEVALALAAGDPPPPKRGGAFGVASSRPLRVFEPVRVVSAPDEARRREVEASHPGTLVWTECAPGDELSDFLSYEDGQSCRYAVVNAGAPDAASRDAKLEALQESLGFCFDPIAPVGRSPRSDRSTS